MASTIARLEAKHAEAIAELEDDYNPLSPEGVRHWEGYAHGMRDAINIATRPNRFIGAWHILRGHDHKAFRSLRL